MTLLRSRTIVCLYGLLCASWAASTRQSPVATGLMTDDVHLTAQNPSHWYSSGLDAVSVQGLQHFLVLWNTAPNWPNGPGSSANGLTVSLYNAGGQHVMDLTSFTDPLNLDANPNNDVVLWPQCIKLDPAQSAIWFSYTTSAISGGWNVSDWFCTLAWDPSLASYPGTATQEFQHNGNFELEWSTDPSPLGSGGEIFVSGLVPPVANFSNGIFHYGNTGTWHSQLVIDAGGYTAGFAFDAHGNCWYAENTFGSNNIYMWTASQINSSLATSVPLTKALSTVTMSTPNSLGGGDVERDNAGNMYFALNGGTFGIGNISMVANDGTAPWPTFAVTLSQTISVWDWQRALSFHGSGDLRAGTGTLFCDMDQPAQGSSTPTITGLSWAPRVSVPGVGPFSICFAALVLALLALHTLRISKSRKVGPDMTGPFA